jgi:hypothetical protein
MDGDDYLVSAALLGRGQDTVTLVADLAARFERSLPNYAKVERSGWGRHKGVKTLTITLESERFRIEVDRRGPHPWIDHIVRGICLKSDQVVMDEWLDRLAATLNNEATKSVDTRLAIEDALR